MEQKCIICGETTNTPWRSAFSHFWFYMPGQLQWWRGNIKAFGFWSGLHASICLSFPFYNTLRHWRHRKSRLDIGGQNV